MYNSKNKKIISSICLFTFFLLTPLSPILTMGRMTKSSGNLSGSIKVLLEKTFQLTASLDKSTGYLAMQISQTKIQTKNQMTAMQWLQEVRSMLASISNDQAIYQLNVIQQAHVICSYIYLLDKLANHIEKTIKNKLNRFGSFDMMETIQKGSSLKLQDIPAALKKLSFKVAEIETLVNDIALTPVNKLARKIDTWIVEPWNNWNMTTITKYAAIGGLFSTILVWKHASVVNGELREEFAKKLSAVISDEGKYSQFISESEKELFQEFLKLYTQDNGFSEKFVNKIHDKTALPYKFDEDRNHGHYDYNEFIYKKDGTLSEAYKSFIYHDTYKKLSDDEGSLVPGGQSLGAWINYMTHTVEQYLKLSGSDKSLQDTYNTSYTSVPQMYGQLSALDKTLTSYFGNQFPYLAPVGSYMFAELVNLWSGRIAPMISQKGQILWNKLRGGAFEKKDVQNVFNIVPTVTLDDVIGMDEVKETLQLILNFVVDPERYFNVGITPPSALLFTGPTRTGKTFMVEAFCGSLNKYLMQVGRMGEFKFFNIPAIVIGKHGIETILMQAKANAPIVLFIDEIDLLQLQRAGGNSTLLSEFLTSMGTTLNNDPSKQVILIAATNKPETLDIALRQNGRFGKEVRFEYPPYEFRKKFLEREFKKMALDVNLFDIEALASKTDNRSFEDLRAIVRSGVIRAWSRSVALSQEILEECLDSEIRNIIMANRKDLPEGEKRILAAHFAGQALAYHLLNTVEKLDKITLKAIMTNLKEELQFDEYMKDESEKQKKIVFGAVFTRTLGDSANLGMREQIINKIKVLVSGYMAEEVILGSCGYSCHPEFNKEAFNMAKNLCLEGQDPNDLSEAKRNDLLDQAFALVKECAREIKAVLQENADLLKAITDQLVKKEGLSDFEVRNIIDEFNNKNG